MVRRPIYLETIMINSDMPFIRALVRNVMDNADTEWTVQGFGFLRTYFGPPENRKQFRLNLWDSTYTVPNVSTIHDHPWSFTSLIVAGEFVNQRYTIWVPTQGDLLVGDPSHSYTTIRTGVGGGIEKSEPLHCKLLRQRAELYMPGNLYSQKAHEIHETKFKDGSVTLNERVGDTERARVFWPYGTPWVDAMPRPATAVEVDRAVQASVERWFQ